MPAICSISCTRFRRAFPGGYFDAVGNPHYCHTDYQGSIIAVTDSTGKVVQTVDYYPYGEPFREPTGQPMLFSGKERTSLADYRFGPRNYNAAGIYWHAPDRKASDFTRFSPYTYCFGNPILFSDPTGMRPDDFEGALMSQCSYQDGGYNTAIEALDKRNWRISKETDGLNLAGNTGNGYKAMLFEKIDPETKNVLEYCYAYAGTDLAVNDIIEDILQLPGISTQYRMAAKNAEKLDEFCGDTELTFVGHSMGGGEAAVASMKTGRAAITYNAASVTDFTKAILNLRNTGDITNVVAVGSAKLFGYKIGGDPVTNFQDNIGGRADGTRINVPIRLMDPLSSHAIKTLVNALAR